MEVMQSQSSPVFPQDVSLKVLGHFLTFFNFFVLTVIL